MSYVGGFSQLRGRELGCRLCASPAVLLLDVARDTPEGKMRWLSSIPVCRAHIRGAGEKLTASGYIFEALAKN